MEGCRGDGHAKLWRRWLEAGAVYKSCKEGERGGWRKGGGGSRPCRPKGCRRHEHLAVSSTEQCCSLTVETIIAQSQPPVSGRPPKTSLGECPPPVLHAAAGAAGRGTGGAGGQGLAAESDTGGWRQEGARHSFLTAFQSFFFPNPSTPAWLLLHPPHPAKQLPGGFS